MPAKVIISSAALSHIEEIADYITAEEGNPTRALALVRALRTRCESLEDLPERGAPFKGRYRRIFEGRYQIIYRIAHDGPERTVYILVVHDMRRRDPNVTG
ncbi:MAG: type II toxin-antitoxin system RelE/ParE family toxin [Pseudomonadota bacterium]